MESERIIFHIDANSAFLSWEAAYRLSQGEKTDLRTIPSVVGGDPKTRHGIVLAKSLPAKGYNIKTGESLFAAAQKCPSLTIVPPDYNLYLKCSNAMVDILKEFSSSIQRFSVDECFMDYEGKDKSHEAAFDTAVKIKESIKKELGFTVNIGISTNKLLAKMASDFKKPDLIHTLFPEEVENKMWPLPVEDLFMVGRATKPKLNRMGIFTIGDLANFDLDILKFKLKKHGLLIWEYANGIENSKVNSDNPLGIKGIGNSTTISFDVEDRNTAHLILFSLTETVGMRLRSSGSLCSLISVSVKSNTFLSCSRQRKLYFSTDSTNIIGEIACQLFDELWNGYPIRHLGVSVSCLSSNEKNQLSLFYQGDIEKDEKLNKAIDDIREKYGKNSLIRSSFLYSGLKPVNGGSGSDSYPVMSSFL
ncbi:MAG: DNA polymerase IV [Bacillota bacterium]|nr:DNA polymerase IV [Bacillota bacterium]